MADITNSKIPPGYNFDAAQEGRRGHGPPDVRHSALAHRIYNLLQQFEAFDATGRRRADDSHLVDAANFLTRQRRPNGVAGRRLCVEDLQFLLAQHTGRLPKCDPYELIHVIAAIEIALQIPHGHCGRTKRITDEVERLTGKRFPPNARGLWSALEYTRTIYACIVHLVPHPDWYLVRDTIRAVREAGSPGRPLRATLTAAARVARKTYPQSRKGRAECETALWLIMSKLRTPSGETIEQKPKISL